MVSAREQAADEIVKQLQQKFGNDFQITPEIRTAMARKIDEHEAAHGTLDSRDEQTCILCDAPRDICTHCDVLDCLPAAPDVV